VTPERFPRLPEDCISWRFTTRDWKYFSVRDVGRHTVFSYMLSVTSSTTSRLPQAIKPARQLVSGTLSPTLLVPVIRSVFTGLTLTWRDQYATHSTSDRDEGSSYQQVIRLTDVSMTFFKSMTRRVLSTQLFTMMCKKTLTISIVRVCMMHIGETGQVNLTLWSLRRERR
jgi:hypothetical protein